MRTKVPELYRLLNEYCVHIQPDSGVFLVSRQVGLCGVRIVARGRILNEIYIFYSATK